LQQTKYKKKQTNKTPQSVSHFSSCSTSCYHFVSHVCHSAVVTSIGTGRSPFIPDHQPPPLKLQLLLLTSNLPLLPLPKSGAWPMAFNPVQRPKKKKKKKSFFLY
jgi:hypothetical protein